MKKLILPIIILSLLFGAGVFAQEIELTKPGLTPDSPFYFLDTFSKRISLFFTLSPANKAEKAFKYAEERMSEVKTMAEKNKTEAVDKANQGYQNFLNLANTKTQEAKEKGKDVEELSILITEKTLQHQEVLVEVFEKVPEEAKIAIEKAIEVSRKGSEQAVQAVTGEKKEELLQKIEEIKTRSEERIRALEEELRKAKEEIKELEEKLGKKPEAEIKPEAPKMEETPKVQEVPKIEEKPFTQVTSPNGGERWEIGKTYDITWKSTKGINRVVVDLYKEGKLFDSLIVTSANLGKSSWTVYIKTISELPGEKYKIRVSDYDNPKIYDESDNYFSIVAAGTPYIEERITVTSPNGGEVWGVGNTYTIFWESTVKINGLTKVNINLLSQKKDDPSTYTVARIASEVDVTKGFYSWQIPPEMPCLSLPCLSLADYPCHKIEVVDSRYGRDSQVTRVISDQSNACFTIIGTIPNTPAMRDIDVSTTAGKPYKIGWATVSGATSYALERDTNSSFSNPVTVYSGSLNSFSGTLSPSVSTTYYFRVKACNNHGCSSWSKITELRVEVIVPSIKVTSPNGGEKWVIGNTYEITWTAVGVDKVTLRINYGRGYLGLGATIPSTGVDATLGKFSWQIPSNLPYAPGDNLKIKITDDSDSTIFDESDNYFSIVSPAGPSLTLISPNGGEKWVIGKIYRISWKSNEDVYVYLYKGGSALHGFGLQSQQYYDLLVSGVVAGDDYKIRITGKSGSFDESDAPFSITEAGTPSITVISPNGGEKWIKGNTYDITWTSSEVENVHIGIAKYDVPSTAGTIISNIPASTGKYSWAVPDLSSGDNYKIRIFTYPLPASGTWKEGVNYDQSDSYFSIIQQP